MKKILFTDLSNTLIGYYSDEIYNGLEKEIFVVSQQINNFLKEGNHVVVVTSVENHDSFGFTFNVMLANAMHVL